MASIFAKWFPGKIFFLNSPLIWQTCDFTPLLSNRNISPHVSFQTLPLLVKISFLAFCWPYCMISKSLTLVSFGNLPPIRCLVISFAWFLFKLCHIETSLIVAFLFIFLFIFWTYNSSKPCRLSGLTGKNKLRYLDYGSEALPLCRTTISCQLEHPWHHFLISFLQP